MCRRGRDFPQASLFRGLAPLFAGTTRGAARDTQPACRREALQVSLCGVSAIEVMKFYESGADLAKDMGVSLSVIEKAHEDHFQAAKKTETNPDGGPWPAYPSGKCWDEAA